MKTLLHARWIAATFIALALAACGRDEAPKPKKIEVLEEPAVFTVLATTDLRDAQALEAMVTKATGVP